MSTAPRFSHKTPKSLWLHDSLLPSYPKLKGKVTVDTVVVGAGITGLTCAYQLQKAGQKVALIDKSRIGLGTSGHTTAHLSTLIDVGYEALIKHFGNDTALKVYESMADAIYYIESLQAELDADFDFERLPGYYYAADGKQSGEIEREHRALESIGVVTPRLSNAPLPFPTYDCIKLDNQGQLHVMKLLEALAKKFVKDGGSIYENTPLVDFDDAKPCVVTTEHGSIEATRIVFATHTPLGVNPLHLKLEPIMSYVVALRAEKLPEWALFWDASEPYNYIRNHTVGTENFVIVGGFDHKIAHGDERESLAQITDYVQTRFPEAEIRYHWSAQFFQPVDGLPFIGKSPFTENVFVATGFNGDGMVFGPLAGRLLSEIITDKSERPYASTFDPARINFTGVKKFLEHNLDVAARFVKDRVIRHQSDDLDSLESGEGRVVDDGLTPMAVYRDNHGTLKYFSASCTHMKCIVRWNSFEKSWDCPCHGSRFSCDGKPLEGPALKQLQEVETTAPAYTDNVEEPAPI